MRFARDTMPLDPTRQEITLDVTPLKLRNELDRGFGNLEKGLSSFESKENGTGVPGAIHSMMIHKYRHVIAIHSGKLT